MNAVTTKGAASSLEAALAKALPLLEGAKKNAANPHFKSKYADLGSVIDAIRPIAEHGIWFRQVLHDSAEGVSVETLYTGFGETISAGSLFMPASKRDAQGFGSAITYARRYALQTAFGLSTEDDDGNAAVKSAPEAAPAKQPAHSALKVAVRNLVHELEGCGDWDTYAAFRETPDFKKVVAAVQEKLPEWWDGGPSMPDEFVPLRRRIELTEANLAESKAQYLNA